MGSRCALYSRVELVAEAVLGVVEHAGPVRDLRILAQGQEEVGEREGDAGRLAAWAGQGRHAEEEAIRVIVPVDEGEGRAHGHRSRRWRGNVGPRAPRQAPAMLRLSDPESNLPSRGRTSPRRVRAAARMVHTAMPDLRPFLPPGRAIAIQLVQGPIVRGTVRRVVDGWVLVESLEGQSLVNLDQVALITQEGVSAVDEDAPAIGLPRPEPADAPRRVTKAPGRAWRDEDLRQLADAFLDGGDDAALAGRFGRERSSISQLRRGFECARGNLVEDQIGAVARTWVERWRRVLAPR